MFSKGGLDLKVSHVERHKRPLDILSLSKIFKFQMITSGHTTKGEFFGSNTKYRYFFIVNNLVETKDCGTLKSVNLNGKSSPTGWNA